jgi:parvulin-like peptidyl-prolyl isomerase
MKSAFMSPLWIFLSGLSLLALGCGEAPDPVVAQVGSHPISAAALRAFVEKLPPGLRLVEQGDAGRRRYLQDLIDRQLLLMEARRLGLDTTQAARDALQEVLDTRVRALYRLREIVPRTQVSPEEVRRFFAAEGYDRERKLNAILVATRGELDAVLGKLKAGQPFARVARAHSLDERSARQGGELGFVGREMAARLNVPPEIFRTLPLGQVSGPLEAGGRWHVVLFSDERPADFERYRQPLETRLSREREAQVEEEHLEHLEQRFQLRLHPEGLGELLGAYQHRDIDSLSASPTALYTYDQGQVSVGRVQQLLRQRNLYRGLADSARATAVLRRAVLRPFLLEEAARRAGLYEEPEIRWLEAVTGEDLLLERLRKTALAGRLNVSAEEARQYYDNNPELFYHQEVLWIQELLLPTEAEAAQARARLEGGATFEELAERSLRKGAAEQQARFHFHPQEKVLYPRLVPALMAAEADQLTGPVEVEGGYSVFRLLTREKEQLEPFETAGRRARALVLRQREDREIDALVARLRAEYASQVEIDESNLRRALPDSLLGG